MYKIIRFYESGKRKTVKTVSTEEIAQLHCSSPKTRGVSKGVKWFDGYTKC